MTTLIRLTTESGSALWVNPSYIASIAPYERGAIVGIGNDYEGTIVQEPPEIIIQKISVIK